MAARRPPSVTVSELAPALRAPAASRKSPWPLPAPVPPRLRKKLEAARGSGLPRKPAGEAPHRGRRLVPQPAPQSFTRPEQPEPPEQPEVSAADSAIRRAAQRAVADAMRPWLVAAEAAPDLSDAPDGMRAAL